MGPSKFHGRDGFGTDFLGPEIIPGPCLAYIYTTYLAIVFAVGVCCWGWLN
ncbi:hypothetical protein K440DRAFT_423759 [Wilcoxina mikolae CBS 423.85]|nr:hypothetical protein K440DRAFT_423759 [Wilcoxina mikolae CBS 423.85]